MTCIIIRRGAYEEFDRLYNAFGHQMPILWDRRAQADTAPSAYHPDRREPPSPSWTALGFVVVDLPAAWARAELSACEADHDGVVPADAPAE